MGHDTVSPSQVVEMLRSVVDPELGADLVSLGMVGQVTVSAGEVVVPVGLTTAACPLRTQLHDDAVRKVSSLHGVARVKVVFSELDASARSLLLSRARRARAELGPDHFPPTARVLAVVACAPRAGASSVAEHLAAALAHRGFVVGLTVTGTGQPRRTVPHGAGELRVAPHVPTAAPGPVHDGWWDGVDYVVVDVPQDHDDTPAPLGRVAPNADVLLVTSGAAPQPDPRPAPAAHHRGLRVVGTVENMAAPAHEQAAAVPGEPVPTPTPVLASVPHDPALATPGTALSTDPLACFVELARKVVEEVSPPVDLSTCTSRLLRTLESAARQAPPVPPVTS